MDSTQRRFNAEHDYQSLDLAPSAEVQVIADIATRFGPVGRLQACRFAEPVDQRFGLRDVSWFNI